jgi:hypothetical protein
MIWKKPTPHLGSAIGTGSPEGSCSKQSDEIMIRFQSDHNLAGLDPAGLDPAGLNPAGLVAPEISGARPRRGTAQGKKPQLRRPEIGARIALYRASRIGVRTP